MHPTNQNETPEILITCKPFGCLHLIEQYCDLTMDSPAYLLSGLLLEAIDDERAWLPFLSHLAKQCNAHVGILFAHSYRSQQVPFVIASGLDGPALEAYRGQHGSQNPWVADQANLAAGSIVASHELPSDSHVLGTAYYADWMRPNGVRYAIGSHILKDDGLAVKLGALRGEAAGPVGRAELGLFRQLMPSLQVAMRLRQRMQEIQSKATELHRALNALSHGVIAVDDGLRVLWANRAAENLLSERDGLYLLPGGQIASDSPQWSRISRSIRASKVIATIVPVTVGGGQAGERETGSFLRLDRPSGKRPYGVQVLPAECALAAVDGRRARALLFVLDPERDDPVVEKRLSSGFALTPAEAKLASLLMRGLSLREAADQLGITHGTARLVSSRIYAKTDAHGQADLVQLLIRSVGV